MIGVAHGGRELTLVGIDNFVWNRTRGNTWGWASNESSISQPGNRLLVMILSHASACRTRELAEVQVNSGYSWLSASNQSSCAGVGVRHRSEGAGVMVVFLLQDMDLRFEVSNLGADSRFRFLALG